MRKPRAKYARLPFDAGNGQEGPVQGREEFSRPGATSRNPLYVVNLPGALIPRLEEDPDLRPYLWDLPEMDDEQCL